MSDDVLVVRLPVFVKVIRRRIKQLVAKFKGLSSFTVIWVAFLLLLTVYEGARHKTMIIELIKMCMQPGSARS